MLTNVIISANELKPILRDISLLIPPGTKTVPVGLTFTNNKLFFTCLGKCNYENYVMVECDKNIAVTIAYSAIHDLFTNGQDVTITVTPQGVDFSSSRFRRVFNNAYSVIAKLEYEDKLTTKIKNRSSVDRLKVLTKTPLTKIYNREPPVNISNEIAILKYENVWYQIRSAGFLYNITVTQECLKILSMFLPQETARYSDDTLMFRRDRAVLFVPVKQCESSNTVTDIIPEEGIRLRLNLGKFSEDVNIVKTVGCKRVEICLFEKGISVHGETATEFMSVKSGDCAGDCTCLFHLPSDLASFVFSVFTDCLTEIIYDKGVLCLRDTDTSIVTHVLI